MRSSVNYNAIWYLYAYFDLDSGKSVVLAVKHLDQIPRHNMRSLLFSIACASPSRAWTSLVAVLCRRYNLICLGATSKTLPRFSYLKAESVLTHF